MLGNKQQTKGRKMTQHTATPWNTVEVHGYVIGAGHQKENHWEMAFNTIEGDSKNKQRANAKFICRSVNCHDALVEALECIRGIGRKNHENPKYDDIYKTVDNALKLAQGGQ